MGTVDVVKFTRPSPCRYVDECQDHTMAEMRLFLLLCSDAKGLFITGDSAQNIEKGVAFRFRDVRSIFYELNETLLQREHLERGSAVAVKSAASLAPLNAHPCPLPSIDYLAHNYR
jgi:hypothetical protein